MRSTSRRMRSVSSTISWARGMSAALMPDLSSWAAPRMPARGFLISCGQHPAEALRPTGRRPDRRPAPTCRTQAARTLRVNRMAPAPSGVADASATNGGWPNRLTVQSAFANHALPGLRRAPADQIHEAANAGGRAACAKRPRASSRPRPWPNRASAATLAATSAPSAVEHQSRLDRADQTRRPCRHRPCAVLGAGGGAGPCAASLRSGRAHRQSRMAAADVGGGPSRRHSWRARARDIRVSPPAGARPRGLDVGGQVLAKTVRTPTTSPWNARLASRWAITRSASASSPVRRDQARPASAGGDLARRSTADRWRRGRPSPHRQPEAGQRRWRAEAAVHDIAVDQRPESLTACFTARTAQPSPAIASRRTGCAGSARAR